MASLFARAFIQSTVFESSPQFHRPIRIPSIRTSPPKKLKREPEDVGVVNIRNLSILFDLNTRSSAFVVPMKSFAQIELPERYQKLPASADAEIPFVIAVFTNAVFAI